jgi:hypothetical protein
MKMRKLRKRHYERFYNTGEILPYDTAMRKGLIYGSSRR